MSKQHSFYIGEKTNKTSEEKAGQYTFDLQPPFTKSMESAAEKKEKHQTFKCPKCGHVINVDDR